MDNFLNGSPVQDDLFPANYSAEIDGFVYVLSSKKIQQGDFLLCVVQSEDSGDLVYIFAVCIEANDNELIVDSNGVEIRTPRVYAKRLTFSIPVNKEHFINN